MIRPDRRSGVNDRTLSRGTASIRRVGHRIGCRLWFENDRKDSSESCQKDSDDEHEIEQCEDHGQDDDRDSESEVELRFDKKVDAE